jgi:hypothetical protein
MEFVLVFLLLNTWQSQTIKNPKKRIATIIARTESSENPGLSGRIKTVWSSVLTHDRTGRLLGAALPWPADFWFVMTPWRMEFLLQNWLKVKGPSLRDKRSSYPLFSWLAKGSLPVSSLLAFRPQLTPTLLCCLCIVVPGLREGLIFL